MNRIDKKFGELKKAKKKALLAYITCGDPNLKTTERLIQVLEKSGVDLIELGIPFSDPLADGPTIQAASERALEHSVNVKDAMRLVRSIRERSEIPILFMTYYNPVLKYGLGRFTRDCGKSGVDGVIVPDLPYEEAGGLMRFSKRLDLKTVFLLAPTSTRDRIANVARCSTGFIYYVSLTGVTGARKKLPKELIGNLKRLKRMTPKPVCVGFGISKPDQARELARFCDGIIVGSAIIKVIEKNLRKKKLFEEVELFVQGLARAIHNV